MGTNGTWDPFNTGAQTADEYLLEQIVEQAVRQQLTQEFGRQELLPCLGMRSAMARR